MPLADALAWTAGVVGLVISAIGFASALSTNDHLFVAGFISVFALIIYVMWKNDDQPPS